MGVRVGLLLSDFLGPLTFDRFSLLRVYRAHGLKEQEARDDDGRQSLRDRYYN